MIKDTSDKRKIIVVLEAACIEVVEKDDGTLKLLTSQDSPYLFQNKNVNKEDARPDILHQAMMTLLDSPLNKSGHLLLYIRTTSNELIEVSSQLSVPSTWLQFEAMMVTFMKQRVIRAIENNNILIKIIKNDLSAKLPAGSLKIGLSYTGKNVNFSNLCKEVYSQHESVVFFIGTVAKSNPTSMENCREVEDSIQISPFHLSSAICCGKLCYEFERLWECV